MAGEADCVWRHHTITSVRREADCWIFEDDQGIGTTCVDDYWGFEPHVGERVSYYGPFRDNDPYTLGCTIERLVIGEQLVWDIPSCAR